MIRLLRSLPAHARSHRIVARGLRAAERVAGLRGVRGVLRLLWAILPRRQDLGPALAAGIPAVVALLAFRAFLAKDRLATATLADIGRVWAGEAVTWTLFLLAGAFLLRAFGGDGRLGRALHRGARVVLHACGTLLLGLTGLELAFFQATGARVDLDALLYLAADPLELMPELGAQVQPWHVWAGVGVVLGGMAPALLPVRRRRLGWPGRLVLVVLLGFLAFQVLVPAVSPPRPLRSLAEPLVALLWVSARDRLSEIVVPPPPAVPPLGVRGTLASPPNIVLVLLESVAYKNTTLHNPDLPTTPQLADLAARGLQVSEAFGVVPHTSKALVSVLCGDYPELSLEVREARWGGLPGRCLPEVLGELGYDSAFFQTARETFEDRLSLVHGLGFDLFRAQSVFRRPPYMKMLNYLGIDDRAMLEPGVAWSVARQRPFLATYVTITTHDDYEVPGGFSVMPFPAAKQKKQRRYLNAVRYVDAFLGDLVRAYEAHGLAENTLFIAFGDHGEAFGEHGRYYHDLTIWDEGMRVPLVLYGPGVLGDRVGVVAGKRQLVDIVPTVLEVVGAEVEGGSLVGTSLLQDVPADRVLHHSCWRSYRCLATRQGDQKFIDHYREQEPQLFNLARDPKEKRDLAPRTDAATLSALRDAGRLWRSEVNAGYAARRERFLAGLQAPSDDPAVATWGGVLDLLGCEVERSEVQPGETVWARCRWRPRAPIRGTWRSVTSLEGSFDAEPVRSFPVDGQIHTFQWEPGVAIWDRVHVTVPPTARPGPATLRVGWQDLWGRRVDGVPVEGGDEQPDLGVGEVRVVPLAWMSVEGGL